jgi:hypothetical protein
VIEALKEKERTSMIGSEQSPGANHSNTHLEQALIIPNSWTVRNSMRLTEELHGDLLPRSRAKRTKQAFFDHLCALDFI